EHSALLAEHCIAGHFLSVDFKIIPAREFCGYAHIIKCIDDRLSEFAEVMEAVSVILSDETEIQVAFIMIDCSAAGDTPHHFDTVLPDIRLIDFFNGILVFTDDDRGLIYIEQEI